MANYNSEASIETDNEKIGNDWSSSRVNNGCGMEISVRDIREILYGLIYEVPPRYYDMKVVSVSNSEKYVDKMLLCGYTEYTNVNGIIGVKNGYDIRIVCEGKVKVVSDGALDESLSIHCKSLDLSCAEVELDIAMFHDMCIDKLIINNDNEDARSLRDLFKQFVGKEIVFSNVNGQCISGNGLLYNCLVDTIRIKNCNLFYIDLHRAFYHCDIEKVEVTNCVMRIDGTEMFGDSMIHNVTISNSEIAIEAGNDGIFSNKKISVIDILDISNSRIINSTDNSIMRHYDMTHSRIMKLVANDTWVNDYEKLKLFFRSVTVDKIETNVEDIYRAWINAELEWNRRMTI